MNTINPLIIMLYKKLEPLIETHITGRLVTFHRALIRRGQIKPPPHEADGDESSIPDYKEDHMHQ